MYLFKQYQKATINFYKKNRSVRKYNSPQKKFSPKRQIKNNVTELIDHDLINKRIGYAVIEFLDEQGRVNTTQTIYKSYISIGREESNDISLPSQKVSRSHCIITYQNRKFFICNLSHTNPTILNGTFVENTSQLYFGDTIQIANYTLRFCDITKKG
jgi:FOG: FHA domain